MIVSMLLFNLVIFTFFTMCYDVIPVWLRIVLQTITFICILVAYGSEDNLRNKVKSLEDEVKNLKKGGDG